MGDYIGAYRLMEEEYKKGKIRAIGISNFYPHVLADICETVETIPAVNQIELHPFFQQENALKLMKEYGVQTGGLEGLLQKVNIIFLQIHYL